ncbi:hypothetical protein OIU77_026511 [Salix suchowensis]|uniref:KOW domain-containing protein n=1 Tax=Salix suchowensis TaxID=1278906 RepID=A0ABQ9BQD6_9ROSI|nr:hypothetical protein OIU78_020107 [Salix suchowensis]KAJ6387963.1 hypothetical protein OIU77_026511 [Salix suchowensis]
MTVPPPSPTVLLPHLPLCLTDSPSPSRGNKDGFSMGQEVRLIFGKKENLGLKGTIVKRLGSDSIVLRVEKSGDPVLVLYGKHKGAYGNLVQRDLDREVGVVQDYGSHDLDRELIDSLGEYCRHPRWRDLSQFKDQKQHIISHFQWKREIREVKLPV